MTTVSVHVRIDGSTVDLEALIAELRTADFGGLEVYRLGGEGQKFVIRGGLNDVEVWTLRENAAHRLDRVRVL
jgi:hypothetical protein